MDALVFMKYVADIERVPADAWDPESGTLRRSRLQMVANPLDDHALMVARRLTENADGRIVALSMGPASAERICRRAVAYGAHDAVLVSDKAFAGSDTLATARVLARAAKVAEARFGLVDPVIVCGMQSPDGDTAQVPAEIAAHLDIPLFAYATEVRLSDGWIECTVMEREHHSRARLCRDAGGISAVVACTGFTEALPFHTTLSAMTRAAEAEIAVWDVSDLHLADDETGLAGSATKVVKIESVARAHGTGTRVVLDEADDPAAEVAEILSGLSGALSSDDQLADQSDHQSGDAPGPTPPSASSSRPTVPGTVSPGGAPPRTDSPGGVLPAESAPRVEVSAASESRTPDVGLPLGGPCVTLCELHGGAPTAATLELVGETRRLAEGLGFLAAALILADELSEATVEALVSAGANRIVRTYSSDAAEVDLDRRSHLLAAAIQRIGPSFVLVPASLMGRTVAALTAGRLGLGLTADCTGLAVYVEDGRARLYQTRPALGGNILATIVSKTQPEMATVRAGVFPRRRHALSEVPVEQIIVKAVPPAALKTERISTERVEEAGADAGADIVVAVGVGIGTREKLEQFVRPLVEALRRRFPVNVTLACSRAAVEADILPYPYQIGQTGKTVRPSLYLALGISGAIQHRLGMENSVRILSVNPDPDAPIHDVSSVSLIATIEQAVPLLTAALNSSVDHEAV